MVASLGIFVYGCDKYLEEDLVSDVSADTFYLTESGFQDAVEATYSKMKEFFAQERGYTMTTFGTDIWTNGADGGWKFYNTYDGGLNSANGYARDTWRDWYEGINQANAVIGRAENVEMDEVLKSVRVAEAHYLRAFYYFHLVITYGDLHLTLEETSGVEVEANRTSAAEIYTQAIIPDLELAVANLPDEQDEYGRATKPAAEFLLGKALLTRSYTSYADENDASQAEALFTSVIDNYGFALLDTYEELWDITNQENSEIIWAMPISKSQVDDGTDDLGHRGHLYFLMEYDVRRGMTRDIANGRPWKRFRPTMFLLNLWDRSMDVRYDQGFKHVWFSNVEAEASEASGDEPARAALAVGDTAIYIPGPGRDAEWPQSLQDSKPYLVITTDEYSERLFPSMKKWLDATRPDRQKEQGQWDYIFMRLADAYLLRAEARLQQEDAAGAAEDINVVRTRAAVEGQETAMQITAGDVNLDFLLDERARELYGEGHRWWDLVRTGALVERTRTNNPQAVGIQDFHALRPIPLDQIDRTLNDYPQNPGYTQ